MTRTLNVLFALVWLAGTCSGSPVDGDGSRQPGVAVDPQLPAAGEPCRPRSATQFLQSFVVAMNEGDAVAQEQILAPDRPFQWYSSTQGRQHFVARTVPKAIALLDERHDQGERKVLRAVSIERDPKRKIVGAAILLTIRADDLNAAKSLGRIAEGKVAIHCERGDLVVWSIGTLVKNAELRPKLKSLCPAGKQIEVGRAVACWQ